MKIGITERGDAGIDLSWKPKVMAGMVDGAVLVTKNITDMFIHNVMDCHVAGRKLIVHATCTGWGGSIVEPGVPRYMDQLAALARLMEEGFPAGNCVLRIDPVFPIEAGLERVRKVIAFAEEKGILPGARIRISIYDEYRHVKERLEKAGYGPLYPDGRFQASGEQFRRTAGMLSGYPYTFHACAEPELSRHAGNVRQTGCISEDDLRIFGLPMPENLTANPQGRHGCLCLSCKTELLTERKQCPHKCIYCYWKG